MKKFVTLLWTVAILGCLTVVAQADAIVGPIDYAMAFVYYFWPWLLIAVVVIITLIILKKYRRK